MYSPHSYVLIFDQPSDDLQILQTSLEQIRCPLIVASSADQVVDRANQSPPYLVILSGNYHAWSNGLLNTLRASANTRRATIVALTDSHTLSWRPLEDNPGLDGFLLKPLNRDVLLSLVQSAWARQVYCSA